MQKPLPLARCYQLCYSNIKINAFFTSLNNTYDSADCGHLQKSGVLLLRLRQCGVSCNEVVDVAAESVVLFGVINSTRASDKDFLAISSVCSICGNKMPTRCNRGFYCRSYWLLNMFRASLCPSSGAQEYYTVVAACGILCCGFFK